MRKLQRINKEIICLITVFCEMFQSSYKEFHSTETALLRVNNDILRALDEGQCVLLILLDLSAAFDTIDHGLLLERLMNYVGVTGSALQWSKDYLADRKQSVLINGHRSAEPCLVLKGMCLDLFCLLCICYPWVKLCVTMNWITTFMLMILSYT